MNILIYKYLSYNDKYDEYLIDKIIHKIWQKNIIKEYMNIDYNQISVSINKPKNFNSKLNIFLPYSKFIEEACFSNSLKFISQYKSNISLEQIIKHFTDGNSVFDIIANIYTNLYFINSIIFNVYLSIYYGIKFKRMKKEFSFDNKYNIVRFFNSKEGKGHIISVINNLDDDGKIIIFDCNIGVFELKNTNDLEKFIFTLSRLYGCSDGIFIYEVI